MVGGAGGGVETIGGGPRHAMGILESRAVSGIFQVGNSKDRMPFKLWNGKWLMQYHK